ncbi:ubiquitin C-terminal hydrolase of the cysteine proteinase fold [Cryptosporidium canis]|nr:ubiquitin C-terminal hydrolase of the cysteine proteinase fold [Cryptosporidium canis]
MRQELSEGESQSGHRDGSLSALESFSVERREQEFQTDVSLQSLYIYNLYNPQLVLLDCNVQLNPFGCYMISENAPRSTKGIWRKNILKDWFGLEGEGKSTHGLDSNILRALTSSGDLRSSGGVSACQDRGCGERPQKYVYSGIKNLGATCYMGSYLQYLFMNLDFRSTFLSVDCGQTPGLKSIGGGQGSSNASRAGGSRPVEGESSLSSMIVPSVGVDVKTGPDSSEEGAATGCSPSSSTFEVILELQKIFRQMDTGRISVVNPIAFAKTLGISTENQEDATEFAVLLLSLLEAKLQILSKLSSKATDSSLVDASKFIPDLFRGTLGYTIECVSCRNRTSIEDHFYELRLQLLINRVDEREESEETCGVSGPEDEKMRQKSRDKDFGQRKAVSGHSSSSTLRLEEAFDNFFKQELLTDENQYMCEKCQCKTDAVKRCLIDRLPPYLHVCLQRYCYDSASMARKKVSVPVDFPYTLNLREYYSGDTRSDGDNGSEKPPSDQFYEYEFIGILEHQGQSAMSGHYTASLKDFQYLSEDELSAGGHLIKSGGLESSVGEEAVVVKKKRGRKPNSQKRLVAKPENPKSEDSKRSKAESEAAPAPPSLDLINKYRIAQLLIQQQQKQQPAAPTAPSPSQLQPPQIQLQQPQLQQPQLQQPQLQPPRLQHQNFVCGGTQGVGVDGVSAVVGSSDRSPMERSDNLSETPLMHSSNTPITPIMALGQASPVPLTPLGGTPLGILSTMAQLNPGISPLNALACLGSPLFQQQLQLQSLYNLGYFNKQAGGQTQVVPEARAVSSDVNINNEGGCVVSRETCKGGFGAGSIDEGSDDSTLVKSSQGSTAVITPSILQESMNASPTPNMGGYGSDQSGSILSQYIQYLQFMQGQQILEANRSLILGSLLGPGSQQGSQVQTQLLNLIQAQKQQELTKIQQPLVGDISGSILGSLGREEPARQLPLINFQSSQEKGLKGGAAPASLSSKPKHPSQKLLHSSPTENPATLTKRRWKWVHFDDTEVQEWTPKFSPCSSSNTDRMEYEKSLLLKKLSVLNLRKQNVTYLKNVILRPSIDRWRDEWSKRLEASRDDDSELVKSYLFGGFLAIPNEWWMGYVHGDDLEQILCQDSGELIKFWSYENLYCRHLGSCGEGVAGGKFLDPFLFWEGKVKLFPPELLDALVECISKENSLLGEYYSLQRGRERRGLVKQEQSGPVQTLGEGGKAGISCLYLSTSMCNHCVESLYGILDISLRQSKVIYEMMRTNISNEREVCLTSTRMFNSLIAKFDLKHKNSSQIFLRESDKLKDGSLGVSAKSEVSTLDLDYNWRSVFTDIKRDIQRSEHTNEQILSHLQTAPESQDLSQSQSHEGGSCKSVNRVQDWSKDIALGSAKCPHGSYIRSKVSGKTVILVPLRLMEEFMRLEEQRSKMIASFVIYNLVRKDRDMVIANMYKSYLRYKCSNKLLPCRHCNTI